MINSIRRKISISNDKLQVKEIEKMSIYILIDYIESCKEQGEEPSFKELHQFKKKYWRD